MLSDAPTTTITTRQSFLMGMNLQLQQQPGFSLAASTTSPAVSINKCPPVLNQTSQFAFSSSLISYPTMHEPGMSSHSGSLNRFGTTSFGGLLPPNRSTTEALLHQQHLLGTLPRGAMGGMGSQGEIPPDVSSFQKTLAAHSFDTAAEVRAKLKLHTRWVNTSSRKPENGARPMINFG